jgi:hypothetical protein
MAEPLRATFYTFRRHGDRGGVLLGATLVTGALSLALLVAFAVLCWPLLASLFSISGDSASSDQVFGAIGAMFWVFLIGLVFVFALYVLFAAYEAACLRWMIWRQAPGLFGLNLSADTWRVYAGYWIWLVIQMVISMVVSILMMPLTFMVLVPVSNGAPETQMASLLGVQFIIYLVQYAVLIFVGVRFAPAAATSIARRRFSFFDAWKVTRGRFWALFGSFFVLGSAYLVVLAVLMTVVFAAVFNAAGGFTSAPMTDPSALLQPTMLATFGGLYLLLLITGVFYVVLSFGVNARAVIAAIDEGKIEGQTPNVAEVFS